MSPDAREAAIDAMRAELGRADERDEEALDALLAAGYSLAGPGGVVVPPSSGAALITAERQRQVGVEGWTAEHDAQHGDDLVMAAVAYATPDSWRDYRPRGYGTTTPLPAVWPWGPGDWKPTPGDRVRELVKAGALIAAEIDRRLAREATPSPEPGGAG